VRQVELLSAADQAVITTDMSGTITYWSEAAAALYGWDKNEVRGRNVLDVVSSAISRDTGQTIMRTIAAGEVWSGVYAVRDRTGNEFYAAVTDVPVVDRKEVIGVVGVSKADLRSSVFKDLVSEFVSAALTLWPGQIDLTVGAGLDRATSTASDPHITQLLALLLLRDVEALDRGERLHVTATLATADILAEFGLGNPAGRCAYVRVERAHTAERALLLREVTRTLEESRYAATLVNRAGGRLFTGATPSIPSATHLFIPIGI
jgi:PAS domain S-box-containing protein